MTHREDMLARLKGRGSPGPVFLPDLTLWFGWHRGQKSLPDKWSDATLPDICRDLGVPVWDVVQPWRAAHPGVAIRSDTTSSERVTEYVTSAGTLSTRWTMGPDGDWWQTEYPAKTADDLPAVAEVIRAREYTVDRAPLDAGLASVGDDGIVALELPPRPYADVVQEFLGWSEGLMILLDSPEAVQDIAAVLEEKLQSLLNRISELPADVMLSPDNLDAQFISPSAFQEHLAESYGISVSELSGKGKVLVVHAGGPVRGLLGPLAESGVAAVEGISGPPQGDTTLAEARGAAGPDLTLWGGIPQEFLVPVHSSGAFEEAVASATLECRADGNSIMGVADRVPTNADLERLRAIPSLIAAVP